MNNCIFKEITPEVSGHDSGKTIENSGSIWETFDSDYDEEIICERKEDFYLDLSIPKSKVVLKSTLVMINHCFNNTSVGKSSKITLSQ